MQQIELFEKLRKVESIQDRMLELSNAIGNDVKETNALILDHKYQLVTLHKEVGEIKVKVNECWDGLYKSQEGKPSLVESRNADNKRITVLEQKPINRLKDLALWSGLIFGLGGFLIALLNFIFKK